jgi:hypothetical protein
VLLRTATLTVLGAGAFFVTPASAGIIYSTNFSGVQITGTPGGSKASELTNAGNYTYQGGFNFGTQSGNGTLAVVNPDVYAYAFSGASNGIVTYPTGDSTSGTNFGILLNSACNPATATCNASNVGEVTLTLTGLTTGQADSVTVQYWAATTGGSTGFVVANPNNLGLTVEVGGSAGSNSLAGSTFAHAVTSATTGNFITDSLTFTPTSSTEVITLLDAELLAGSAGNPPAPIIGDISVATVATPEPSTALFLLVPAALFAVYRRRSVRQN